MDSMTLYRQLIRRIINEYAAIKPSYGDVQIETIFDESNDHYELVYTGWDNWKRIHGAVLHVDIRDGKIWIQHDGTEDGIVDELLEAGVPEKDIVMAWHPPDLRKHTPFAVS